MIEVWRVPSDDNPNEIVEIRPVVVVSADTAKDVVERCLIHWFPDAPPSRRRDVARSILAALTVADYLADVEGD
jgi:mRNA-degrading endonuclease toxin of MazEF toxin-antitoxin module